MRIFKNGDVGFSEVFIHMTEISDQHICMVTRLAPLISLLVCAFAGALHVTGFSSLYRT